MTADGAYGRLPMKIRFGPPMMPVATTMPAGLLLGLAFMVGSLVSA